MDSPVNVNLLFPQTQSFNPADQKYISFRTYVITHYMRIYYGKNVNIGNVGYLKVIVCVLSD